MTTTVDTLQIKVSLDIDTSGMISSLEQVIAALKAFTPPAQPAPEPGTASSLADATSPINSGAADAASSTAETTSSTAATTALPTPGAEPQSSEVPTRAKLSELVTKLCAANKKKEAAAVLEKLGVKKVPELKDEQIAECYQLMRGVA